MVAPLHKLAKIAFLAVYRRLTSLLTLCAGYQGVQKVLSHCQIHGELMYSPAPAATL